MTVHGSTLWPYAARAALAAAFGIPEGAVRVLAPYVGGGFGAGLRCWPHVILAAMASRTAGRPVKLVLIRPQMFTGVGHRPGTVQRLKLGATRTGELTVIDHQATSPAAMQDINIEPVTLGSAGGYACPNIAARDQQKRLNIPVPGSMRAPGDAQGNFALESAMDELAYALGADPLELRLRNYAETHPQLGLRWSSKALRACYQHGAERFGWSQRSPRVDPDLGLVRVTRVVSAIDGGRILNEKTARSQIIGGTVGGIGMALLEETITDPSGRIANPTFSDYLVPVNADVPDMDVLFVGEPDRFNPIGVKGIGEIGLVGIAAAIANAVFHATGRRVRSLPITIDQLL